MNTIKQLIEKYCPDGVEYKKLIDVANVLYGFPFVSKLFTDDSSFIPLIRIRDVLSGKASTYYEGQYDVQYIIKRGDILIGMDGNFNLSKWNDRDGILNQRVVKINSKDDNIVLNGFLFHLLGPVFKDIEKTITGSTVKHLSAKSINSISIPIPPLSVQREIVRILDSFTSLEAELEAELEARRKQYEYYRDQLLSFNYLNREDKKEVEWKTLGEVFEMRNGYTPSKSHSDYWEGGTIPWFRMEDIRTCGRKLSDSILHITEKGIKGKGLFEKGTFILATTATIGEHALLIVDSLANQRFTNLKIRKSLTGSLSVDFVFYYMFVVDEFCKKHTNKSGFESVDMKALNKMPFPIPPLSTQHRIVSILDRFESLVNNITSGLPAEIAARHQQYEYYRDQLLSFKRKS